MTLQQLRYIIEVANQGSINEAAKKLFITQPSLSNAIKDIENEFGIEIFQRTNKGINLSQEGVEFLSYARQVIEQAELLETRYLNKKPSRKLFSVSTQHYAFAVNAFVDLLKEKNLPEYEFTLRETRTYEIIEDVKNLKSEVGILYLNDFNSKVLNKIFKENSLIFTELFKANPYIFVSHRNPLAKKKYVTLEDLEDYPYLSFEQGEYNSFHFAEEILSTLTHKKSIQVSDRATLFNLLIGLNGYTISYNGNDIVSIPLKVEDVIKVGWICHKSVNLSPIAKRYIELLKINLNIIY